MREESDPVRTETSPADPNWSDHQVSPGPVPRGCTEP